MGGTNAMGHGGWAAVARYVLAAASVLSAWGAASGCTDSTPSNAPEGRFFQAGTLQAVMDGDYYGYWSIDSFKPRGNVGLGTFEGIDGELVVVDGVWWHVLPDGSVEEVAPGTRTPFVQVIDFAPERSTRVSEPLDCGGTLDEAISQEFGFDDASWFVGTLRGEFSEITTRAIDMQYPPYRPFADLVGTENRFPMSDVNGVAVLVRSPAYAGTLSSAGFHYHFVTENREQGGHVVSCTFARGTIQVQRVEGLEVALPPVEAAH